MLKRLWRLALERPAFFGLCLVAAGEAIMNAAFGYLSATHWFYASLLAMIYAGSEMAKWFAADAIGAAAHERSGLKVGAAVLLLCCTLSISIPAHIGFIGMMRDGSIASRDNDATKRGNAKQNIEDARTELKAMPPTRSAKEITPERDLECAKRSARYPDGKGPACTKLEAELGRADRKVELLAIIGGSERTLEDNKVAVVDARVTVMKWVWPEAQDQDLQLMLSVAIALCIEAVTAFGFLVFGYRRDEVLSIERLVADGAATLPATDHIVPFRNQALEVVPGGRMSADQLCAAYERWAMGGGREPMQRAAFLRLLEACGVRRVGDTFLGIRSRAA
jgi:hypothetical protein